MTKKKTKKKKANKKNLKVDKIDVVADAVRRYKKDESDWKTQDQSELYGIESYIDAFLYEKKYAKYGYVDENGQPVEDSELILERLTFQAIQKLQGGRRHTCDMYYDDAFNGYDGY